MVMVCGGSGTCHALRPHAVGPLIRDHALQHRLVGGIRQHSFVKLSFPLARLRGQNMPGEGVVAHHLAGPGLLEPLGRTFVSLQLGHRCSWIVTAWIFQSIARWGRRFLLTPHSSAQLQFSFYPASFSQDDPPHILQQNEQMHGIGGRRDEIEMLVEASGFLVLCMHRKSPNSGKVSRSGASSWVTWPTARV